MKTEWTQEPHTTVRWALIEALRASDNASTVDYWDVVTENLIRQLGLRQEWGDDEGHDWFKTGREAVEAIIPATKRRNRRRLVTRLITDPKLVVSEWKRLDSDE